MPTYLSTALRARLETQKVPYKLVDGPERLTQSQRVEPHITLQRDPAGDTWKEPISRTTNNPSYIMTRVIGMQLLVYARGRVPSPSTIDHEDEGDSIVKQLIAALYHIMVPWRVQWRLKPSRYLTREEIEELNLVNWNGRIYLLPFELEDAIEAVDYDGDALPEFEFEAGDIVTSYDIDSGAVVPGGLPSATTELSDP